MTVIAAVGLLPSVSAAQPQFEVVRFEGIPGYFWGRGLAADGTVSGYSEVTATQRTAYTWKDGVASPLYGYASLRTFGSASNSAGLVVGQAEVPPGGYGQAAIWQNGSFTNIGTVGGVPGSSGCVDVNESGWITGNSASPDGGGPFIYRNGVMESLGDLGLPGINIGGASAISDSGHVVGSYSDSENNNRRAFIWTEATGMELLSDDDLLADDVNDSGQVVGLGRHTDPGRTLFGYLWQNGSYVELANRFMPRRINNLGDMVGFSDLGVTLSHAGTLYDLNNLLMNPGWRVTDPQGFNDAGQILVRAFQSPQGASEEWVLLNPVPEQGAVTSLSVLLTLLLFRILRDKRV